MPPQEFIAREPSISSRKDIAVLGPTQLVQMVDQLPRMAMLSQTQRQEYQDYARKRIDRYAELAQQSSELIPSLLTKLQHKQSVVMGDNPVWAQAIESDIQYLNKRLERYQFLAQLLPGDVDAKLRYLHKEERENKALNPVRKAEINQDKAYLTGRVKRIKALRQLTLSEAQQKLHWLEGPEAKAIPNPVQQTAFATDRQFLNRRIDRLTLESLTHKNLASMTESELGGAIFRLEQDQKTLKPEWKQRLLHYAYERKGRYQYLSKLPQDEIEAKIKYLQQKKQEVKKHNSSLMQAIDSDLKFLQLRKQQPNIIITAQELTEDFLNEEDLKIIIEDDQELVMLLEHAPEMDPNITFEEKRLTIKELLEHDNRIQTDAEKEAWTWGHNKKTGLDYFIQRIRENLHANKGFLEGQAISFNSEKWADSERYKEEWPHQTEVSAIAGKYKIPMAFIASGAHTKLLTKIPERIAGGKYKLILYDPMVDGELVHTVTEDQLTNDGNFQIYLSTDYDANIPVDKNIFPLVDGTNKKSFEVAIERMQKTNYDLSMPTIPQDKQWLLKAKMGLKQTEHYNCGFWTIYQAAIANAMKPGDNLFKQEGMLIWEKENGFSFLRYEDVVGI